MTDAGFTLDRDAFRRTREAVLRVESEPRNQSRAGRRERFRGQGLWINEGVLDVNLPAPGAVDPPTTATLSIYRKNAGGAFVDTGNDLVVTNRDPSFSANAGDFLGVRYLAGEWRPITGGPGGGGGDVAGGVRRVTVANYTPVDGDLLLLADTDAAAGSININLAGGADGKLLIVKTVGVLLPLTRNVQVSPVQQNNTASASIVLPIGGAETKVVRDNTTGVWWGA